MSDIRFTIDPVDKKPQKPTNKGKPSKYAPIIDAFLKSGHKLVRVDNTGLDGNYLRQQLIRVVNKKGIKSIKVSVRNNEVYLSLI